MSSMDRIILFGFAIVLCAHAVTGRFDMLAYADGGVDLSELTKVSWI